MIEIWKDIPEYEGIYQVSNLGRIKSFYKYGGTKERILTPRYKKGYYQIGLRKNGIRKWHAIHRLVGKAFIPNPNNFPQINHINENKLDNRSENLEWCTVQYNNTYGTRLKKVSNTNKLKKEVIKYDLDGNFVEEYPSLSEARRKNNIKYTSEVTRCCQKKSNQTHGWVFRFKREVV